MHDPTVLPAGLPAPVDDGAADHLPGRRLPSIGLPSTAGGNMNPGDLTGGHVLFVYPKMGSPEEDPPEGWDDIPGARGCTPQACSFRDRYSGFAVLGYGVAGLSTQASAAQAEAKDRLHLPYELLSDSSLRLADELGLPTFEAFGERLYKRLTIVARDGVIVKVFYPVFPPDENAGAVLDWISAHQ